MLNTGSPAAKPEQFLKQMSSMAQPPWLGGICARIGILGTKSRPFGCWLKAVPQVEMPNMPDWDQVPGEASTRKKVKVTQAEDPGRPKKRTAL